MSLRFMIAAVLLCAAASCVQPVQAGKLWSKTPPPQWASWEQRQDFCGACGVVAEELTRSVRAKLQQDAHYMEGFTFGNSSLNIEEMITELCESPLVREAYHEQIEWSCTHIKEYYIFVFTEWYANNTVDVGDNEGPDPRTEVWKMKRAVCGEIDNHCRTFYPLEGKKLDECQACRTNVGDMLELINREKRREDRKSKKHIWSIMESLCDTIPWRHPRLPRSLIPTLYNSCEDMMSDHDLAIAKILRSTSSRKVAERKICVARAGACTSASLKDEL